jgi:malate synthase
VRREAEMQTEVESEIQQTSSPVGMPMNTAPKGGAAIPDQAFLDFLRPLHEKFTPRQQELLSKRHKVLNIAHHGQLPQHLAPSQATQSEWKIELPEWVADQRNQMTGPADDAELVVKMLNSGAPGVMLDLEDSMANRWENLQRGIENILSALRGELTYNDKKRQQTVGIKPSKTVIQTRARGLHISQAGVFAEPMSASLYDVARIVYQADFAALKHPLTFYIPKTESAEEALWWRDLFQELERYKGLPKGSIKCMALVESHPLAFQIEEFIFNLRDHLLALNLGRWDYMASLIHFNLADPNWVLPDRNTIPHDVAFFQNLRLLIPNICHSRGILAIGGMTALYPSREDAELNERALKVLAQDKKNEANCGMDGAWTGHPDQNQIAVDQFPVPNQLTKVNAGLDRYPDLRPVPTGVGKRTVAGTRAAVRTVIRYRNGVLNGRGASLLDGYMEDLATDRIYRLMIAQRMQHADKIAIEGEDGKPVRHTPQLVTKIFDEELEKILSALPKDVDESAKQKYREARRISEAMIVNREIDPI